MPAPTTDGWHRVAVQWEGVARRAAERALAAEEEADAIIRWAELL